MAPYCCWHHSRGSEARGFELEVLRVSASKLLHSLALGQIDARALLRTISLPEYWARHSTHIVMFPQGVVGIEYSWLGPKPVQLFSFFNGLAKGHSDVVAFRQVVTGPRQSDLRSLVDIRSIEIRASYVAIQKVWEWLKEICEKTPYAEQLRHVNDGDIANDYTNVERQCSGHLSMSFRAVQLSEHQLRRLVRVSSLVRVEADSEGASVQFRVRGKQTNTGKVAIVDLLRPDVLSQRGMVWGVEGVTGESSVSGLSTGLSIPRLQWCENIYAVIRDKWNNIDDGCLSYVPRDGRGSS